MDKKNNSRKVKDSARRFVPAALFALAFAIGVTGWLMPAATQAQSVYDELFTIKGDWVAYNGTAEVEKNIWDEAGTVWSESTNPTCLAVLNDWNSMNQNPNFWYRATQQESQPANVKTVTILFGVYANDINIVFNEPQNNQIVAQHPYPPDTNGITFGINNNGDTYLATCLYKHNSVFQANMESIIYDGPQTGTWTRLINVRGHQWKITYPSGYQGGNFENYIGDYIAPRTDVPDIKLRGVLDWEGTFSDDNFLSVDEVPFTCEEGLAPVLSGELWDDTGTPTMIDTFTASSTALFTIKFDKENTEKDYRIVSWYVCDDGVNNFTDAAHYPFTITGFGTLKNESFFEDCIKETFPFIDFNACVSNIFTVINMLYFKEVNVGSGWNSTTGCYTLTTVHTWIKIDNPVVCPAINGSIRALITPFVVFLLGLGTVHIINRGIGKGDA